MFKEYEYYKIMKSYQQNIYAWPARLWFLQGFKSAVRDFILH